MTCPRCHGPVQGDGPTEEHSAFEGLVKVRFFCPTCSHDFWRDFMPAAAPEYGRFAHLNLRVDARDPTTRKTTKIYAPRKPLTPEKERRLLALLREGHTCRAIAREIGVQSMTVWRYQRAMAMPSTDSRGR